MSRAATINWIAQPEFRLLTNGGLYNKFQCARVGAVRLTTEDGSTVVIGFPERWVTDVTSSPLWSRSLVPQLGAHAPAALLHDRLLDLGWPRALARYWMAQQLKALPLVRRLTRSRMIAGVWLRDQQHKFKK